MKMNWTKRNLVITGIIGAMVLLGFGMWLGSQSAKQSTRSKPESAQIQIQAEKKKHSAPPVVALVPTPAVLVPAPVSATPVIQNNINVYPALAPAPAPVPSATALVPTPPATPTPQSPAPVPQSFAAPILLGQPQAYYNSWGWWLVDPNGGFHCPPVANPTTWTGGQRVFVKRPDGRTYEAWAPACYR